MQDLYESTKENVQVATPILAAGDLLCGVIDIVTHSHTRLDRLAPAVHAAALWTSRRYAPPRPAKPRPQQIGAPATTGR